MTTINVSAKLPYHTQVNNRYYPLSSCNTTSAIMFLLDNHVPFEFPAGMQPEDHLTAITELPACYEHMRQVAPWAWDGNRPRVPPRQVHACLEWAMTKLVGKQVSTFRTDVSWEELAHRLALGQASLLSTQLTRAGHVVVLVGVATKQPLEEMKRLALVRLDQIVSWTIDDPYGDYHREYQDQHGNDVTFLRDELDRLVKAPSENRKWAHVRLG